MKTTMNGLRKKLGLGAFSLLATVLFTASFGNNIKYNEAYASGADVQEALSTTELNRDQMRIFIKEVTSTSSDKKSLTFQFESIRPIGYGITGQAAYVVCDDPNFSGINSNPLLNPDPSITKPYQFKGYVKEVCNVRSAKNLVIPTKLTYGNSFHINADRIFSGTLDLNGVDEKKVQIQTLIISNEFTTIQSGAFVNIPDSITIKCEATSKPEAWASDWTDAKNVEWGYTLTNTEVKAKTQATGTNTKAYGEAVTYMIGYVYEKKSAEDKRPAFNLPLTVECKIDSALSSRTAKVELPVQVDETTGNPYNIVAKSTFDVSCDYILEEGESIDYSSFVFSNIYTTKKDANNYLIPDTTVQYSCKASKLFDQEVNMSSLITYSFSGVSSFGGYTMININVNKNGDAYYKAKMAEIVESNKDKINSGEYIIRYAIYSIYSSSYRITYTAGNEIITKVLDIKSRTDTLTIEKEKNNKLGFLIKNSDVGSNFDPNNIVKFEYINLTINIHLWNVSGNNKVARSECLTHFSAFDIIANGKEFKVTNLTMILGIVLGCYVVVFAAVAVGLFFYLREKNKNDEFTRMKPKKYIKNAIIYGISSFIVVFTIVALIMRGGPFANSVAVFNPLDIYIVILGLISIVIIGYFIKNLVAANKARKMKKERKRLKLDEKTE